MTLRGKFVDRFSVAKVATVAIERCCWCPNWSAAGLVAGMNGFCKKDPAGWGARLLDWSEGIPTWCPLPDAGESEETTP